MPLRTAPGRNLDHLHELPDAPGLDDDGLVAQLRTIDQRHRRQVEAVPRARGGLLKWLPPGVDGGGGIRLLSLLELPGILLNPGQLQWGNLNLVGLTNPISLLLPKRILFGDVSYWTANDHIVWGDDITSPEGQHIVWGDNDTTDDYHIVWGDRLAGTSDGR